MNDMPRYIDVDKAITAINDEMFMNENTKSLFRMILRAIPAADVVPRAEVMRLVGECYEKCDECRSKIADTVRAEVAREIFDDVIKILNNEFKKCEKDEVQIVLKISKPIFELKKKYTEDQK